MPYSIYFFLTQVSASAWDGCRFLVVVVVVIVGGVVVDVVVVVVVVIRFCFVFSVNVFFLFMLFILLFLLF